MSLHDSHEDSQLEPIEGTQRHGPADTRAILRATYEAASSENATLHRRLAAMYAQISQLTGHIQCLSSACESSESLPRGRKRRIVDDCCNGKNDGHGDADGFSSTPEAASCVKQCPGLCSKSQLPTSTRIDQKYTSQARRYSVLLLCPVSLSSRRVLCHRDTYHKGFRDSNLAD